MADRVYIEAERVKDAICECAITDDEKLMLIRRINRVIDANVVSRDAFDRLLAENDDMRAQLAEIGKKPGDEMSDLRRIREDLWVLDSDPGEPWRYRCPICGEKCKETVMGRPRWNFCPMCGTLLENNL